MEVRYQLRYSPETSEWQAYPGDLRCFPRIPGSAKHIPRNPEETELGGQRSSARAGVGSEPALYSCSRHAGP